MNRNSKTPKLDLKLHLSPPRATSGGVSPDQSPQSSCVSSELSRDENCRYSSSPEATPMMLAGCPRCLVYLMLSRDDPKCPKCKSTVLLDFHHEEWSQKAKK